MSFLCTRFNIILCVCNAVQAVATLQRVAGEVSLDGVPEGVGALEHLAAGLLPVGPLAGVQVLVEDLPEVVGHVHDLEVLGEPEIEMRTKNYNCFLKKSKL